MIVYLSGLGEKYHKKGWFNCIVIKENKLTKVVRIPELKDIIIKVKNKNIKVNSNENIKK